MLDDRPLDPAVHDRQGFACGVPALDDYIRRFAEQHRRRGISSVYVLTDSAQPALVLGYYTLSAAEVDRERLTEAERNKLPRYPVPCFRMGRLACRSDRQGSGLGKLLAEISTGEGDFPDSFRGSLSLPGWREERTGVKQEQLSFLSVETGPTLPSFRSTSPERSIATLLQSRTASWLMGAMGGLSNFIDSASMGMVPTTMRTIGLKQYRDALDSTRAVYQALVTCRSVYSNIRNFKFYNENDVVLGFNDVGSFHEILSVFLDNSANATNATIPVVPAAAFRFEADIDYDTMRVIHRFPLDGAPGEPATPAESDLVARWFRPWHGFFGAERP